MILLVAQALKYVYVGFKNAVPGFTRKFSIFRLKSVVLMREYKGLIGRLLSFKNSMFTFFFYF